MPVSFNGQCYKSAFHAMTAFNLQFPYVLDGYQYTVSNVQLSGNVMTYTLQIRNVVMAKVQSRSSSMVFLPCEKATVPYDYSTAGAIWVFCFSFTVGLWWLSKNVGLVLRFVRQG